MIDPITSAAGKLDDPLMWEWAETFHAHLPDTAQDDRARLRAAWFHDAAIARLIEQQDFTVLSALFRVLPPEYFANLADLMLRHWAGWPGDVAGLAIPALALQAPEALLYVMEEYLDRAGQAGLEAIRFSQLAALRGVGPTEQRSRFLERLARSALALPDDELGKGLLLTGVLRHADTLRHETLEQVLLGALAVETRAHMRDSILKVLFRGLFGHIEYFDLVMARGKGESAQGLRTLAPVFRPETPLDRFERWLDELPAPNEALEFLAADTSEAAATLHRLLNGGAVPTSLSSKQVAQLAVAGCIQACAADSVDASGLSLAATVDLLAADLDDPRWFQAVRERLSAFPRDEVTARLIERLPMVGNTYGAIQIARAMGELAWDEFVPCLIDGLRQDQLDFLCEAADTALVQIGAAARDALIAQWNGLDSSQHIYGLSVIRDVGGLPAADFAIEHADELLDSELESFCELALAVPDTRLLERLRPELRRKQVLIDRAFAILARLLGHEDAAAEEAQQRALADYERTRLQRERFTLGDFHRDKLSLSLRCPACGSTNVYDVRSVIMPGQDHGDLPYLVDDEFPCASCGAYTEFEVTPTALMALSAEVLLVSAAHASGQERQPLIRRVDYRIEGRVIPVAAGLGLLRERIRANPADRKSRFQLALLYTNIGRPRAAMELLDRLVNEAPDIMDVTLLRAQLLAQDAREGEALGLLAGTWERHPAWRFFGDARAVHHEYIAMYNALRRKLRRRDLPELHPASAPAPGKVGRNDPCPCGSGKKFKKCCGG